MRSHLVGWNQQYADDGLVIIEVDGGKFTSLDEVRRCLAKQKIGHLILWDEDNRNHGRYGIQAWPSAYLIGTDGKVVWEGNLARIVGRPQRLQWFKALIENELKHVRRVR